jgi:hypothetical protein
VTGVGLLSLISMVSSPACQLTSLLLSNMPRVDDARLAVLLRTWSSTTR